MTLHDSDDTALLALATDALRSIDARRDEDVGEWARRLAREMIDEDLANALAAQWPAPEPTPPANRHERRRAAAVARGHR